MSMENITTVVTRTSKRGESRTRITRQHNRSKKKDRLKGLKYKYIGINNLKIIRFIIY